MNSLNRECEVSSDHDFNEGAGCLSWGRWVVGVICVGIVMLSFSAGGHLQMLISPMVAWVLMGVLLLFVLGRVLREREMMGSSLSLVFLPWLIYVVVNYCCLSLTPWYGRVELLGFGCAGVVFGCVILMRGRDVEWLGKGVMGFGVLVIFVTMFQEVMGASWHPVGGVNSIRAQYGERLSSVFSMPNSLGCCMLLVLPYFLLYAFCKRKWQLSYGLGAVACMWALHASVSRASVLIAVPVILLCCYVSGVSWKWRVLRAVLVLLVHGGMYLVVASGGEGQERFERLAKSGGEVTREVYFAAAHALFESAPIFGVGLGNFQVLWDQQFPVNRNHGEYFTHSDYLQTLCETGLVGAGLLFGAVALVVLRGARKMWGERKCFSTDKDLLVRVALCGLLGFGLYQLVNFESKVWANFFVSVIYFAVLVRYGSRCVQWRCGRGAKLGALGVWIVLSVFWGGAYRDTQSSYSFSKGSLALSRVQGVHGMGLRGPKKN
ncbi:O-antigen ligase family protein [Rubritalea spongiae]|uniref:O-antigen ligase family protein n=1 Tax=Rubritalea spongiae TaxID=430797 RepID=UPI00360C7166